MVAATDYAFDDIGRELDYQVKRWGVREHPDFDPGVGVGESLARVHGIICEDEARSKLEEAFRKGRISWAHILIEEVAELFGTEGDWDALRGELVQVAAVATTWINAIDRREQGERVVNVGDEPVVKVG